MATYVEDSDLVQKYVDESDLVGSPVKKETAAKKKEPDVGTLRSLFSAALTGGSAVGGGLLDLITLGDASFKRRLGIPHADPTDVAGKVQNMREMINQGTLFPEKREMSFPERAVQGATGSLAFPGGVISNVGASVTSDTIQEVLKQAGASRPAQAAAGVLAAIPWSLRSPMNVLNTPQRQAEKALAPYSDQMIDEGVRLQRLAQIHKNPITPSQALNDQGRVLDLENFVMDYPGTPKTLLEEARRQPQAAQLFAEKATRALVGPANTSLKRANEVEAVIEEALQLPQKVAGKAADPYYKILEATRPDLSVSSRFSLADALRSTTENVGLLPKSEAGRAANKVASVVVAPSSILDKSGKPFMLSDPDIRKLDNYLKQVNEKVSGTYSPFATPTDKLERAGLVPSAQAIRQTITGESVPLRRGKEVYKETVDRLEPGVRATGLREAVARPAMEASTAKAPASWEKLENVLKRGNETDVVRAYNIMATEKGGAQSFADITKNAINRIFEKHYGIDSPSPTTATSFAEELKKYPNISKAVELTAFQRGATDPVAVSRGFMRMLDIEQASGRARGLPGGSTLREIEKYASGKSAISVLFGHAIARSATVVRNINYLLNKAEMERLSNVFSSPNSLELLRQLGQERISSVTQNTIYKALIGASQAEEQVQPD